MKEKEINFKDNTDKVKTVERNIVAGLSLHVVKCNRTVVKYVSFTINF